MDNTIYYFRVTYILTICFLFLSCNNNKSNNKSLNKNYELKVLNIGDRNPVNISDFTSDMDIIKLETSSKCLLADIREIKFDNNLIYITDVAFKGIYVFNFKGKLIKTLNKEGKGAGEYLSVDDFIIDNSQHSIEIFDRVNMKIFIYNLEDFSFKKSISLPLSFSFKFSKLNGIYYFQTNGARNQIEKKITNSEIIAYDLVNKKMIPLFEKVLPESENQTWEFSNIFTTNEQNDLFASFAWHDKIYQIEENIEIKPIISVNSSSKKYPKKIITGRYEDKMSFLNSEKVKGKINFFKLLLHEDKDLIIGYGLGYPPIVCHYIQLDNEQKILNTNNIRNDYLPFKYENIEIFKEENGFLLSVIQPYNESKNTQLLNYFKIKDKDNPIILLFKLAE